MGMGMGMGMVMGMGMGMRPIPKTQTQFFSGVIDGTFKNCPKINFQLMMIQCIIKERFYYNIL